MTVEQAKKPTIQEDASHPGSRLFSHFRSVGVVANTVPASVHYLGGIPYVAASIGKSFQIFDVFPLLNSSILNNLLVV